MITNTYSPFTDNHGNPKTIFELELKDLKQIQEKGIEEGPYIEFKRELSNDVKKKLPNIITSFANERGGWFFIGIDEDDMELNYVEGKEYELTINNILKSNTSPIPRIITKFLSSEEDPNKGIFVAYIPEGENAPYISKGKTYRRVGSGSSPIEEIKDRYYLDKLYEKSEKNKNKLLNFCKKDISVFNRNLSGNLGMCNIYLIPTFKFEAFNYLNKQTTDKFIADAIESAIEPHTYTLKRGSALTFSMPFNKMSYSHKSIVFRNNTLLDQYKSSIAWEQFVDGTAKFHIPLTYKLQVPIINRLKANLTDYESVDILYDFQFIDGELFIENLLNCINTYFHTMKKTNPNFEEIIVSIELNDIRNNVLFFDTDLFMQQIQEKGLVFSERKNYLINEEFESQKVIMNDLNCLFNLFFDLFNAFGLSVGEGLKLFFDAKNQLHLPQK
ncbi:helix-turn-helix domain-containing protein [Bacillus sp. BR_16]|uniref:AlbA family DNA-binding domain-containing protein n=1 Tax=Bacillus sp. BR_16 TaxID=3055777 RepID=UPI0035C1ABAF